MFVRKLYRLFKNRPEIFRLDKLPKIKNKAGNIVQLYGECLLDGTEIAIDYRHDLLSTLLHEALHYFHPECTEREVLSEEKWLVNNLSSKQIKNILKRFAEII